MLENYPHIARVVTSGAVQKLLQPEALEKINSLLNPENLEFFVSLSSLFERLGVALPPEQQLFVAANWQERNRFLETDIGKVAVQQFIADWQDTVK